MKAKKKLTNVPKRLDDESSCSSESDRSDDDFEYSELSDDALDNQSDWDDDSPMYSSGSDRCCSQAQYSDESD